MSNSAEPEVIEQVATEEPLLPAADETIFRMRQAVLDGQHWFEAILDAVGRWRVPLETMTGDCVEIADRAVNKYRKSATNRSDRKPTTGAIQMIGDRFSCCGEA